MNKIRIVFGFVILVLFVYLSIGQERVLDKEETQERINSVIPFSFKQGNGKIIINEAKLINIKKRIGLQTEIVYDTSYEFVKDIKSMLSINHDMDNETMIFKFSFDIVKEDGIIYFDNIGDVSANWKKTGDAVKIFSNKRFVSTFVRTMEDVKLYRIGDVNPFSKKSVIISMIEFDGVYSDDKNNILVNYKLKDRYVLFVFLIMVLSFGREISIFFIHIYQKVFSKRKNFICAKGVHTGVTCSNTVLESMQKDGFFKGVIAYNNALNDCKESYLELKKIKKGKKLNKNIRETKIKDCVLFFKK